MANFDFTDPTNQGRDVPRDPFDPTSGGFDINDSATMRQALEGINVLVGRIETGFAALHSATSDFSNLLEKQLGLFNKSADAVDRISKSQGKSADHTRKQIADEQRLHEVQKRRQDAVEKINQAEQKGANAIREQMRTLGMYNKQGYQIPGAGRGSAADIDDIVAGNRGQAARNALLERLRNEAAQTAGQPDDRHFRLGEVAKALSRGDVYGAVGEGFQRFGLGERTGSGLERAGMNLGGPIGNLLMRFGPAIGGLLSPVGLYGAYRAYRSGIHNINETRDIGMITGQGFTEGLRARGTAFVGGLNPFDMISGRDALAAQMSVRQAGFSGRSADQAADLVTDLRQKLGLPISDSAALVVTALRTTNMTLGEARLELSSLKDSAHDAGLSVKELADSAQTAMTALAPLNRQAAQQALPNIEALTSQYQGLVPKQTLGTLGSVMTAQTAQTLAQRMGIPAWQALSPSFFNRLPMLLNQFILNLANRKPDNMDYVDYANFLFMADPTVATMFQGTGPQGLADLMKAVSKQAAKGGVASLQRGQLQQQATMGSFFADQAFKEGRGGLQSGQRSYSPSQIFSGGSAALRQLQQAARQMGLTTQQIQMVTDPLRAAIASGDSTDIKSAVDYGGRELGTLARHGNITVKLDIAPGFDKYLRATSQWNEVQAGRRSAQEVPRFP